MELIINMNEEKGEFNNDHDAIITLISETRSFRAQTTKDIEELKKGIYNLQTAFVPRTEFERLSTIVVGVANDGGLMKRVADIEEIQSEQKGVWTTVQVFWTMIIGVISALGALGLYISIHHQ